MLKIKLKKEPAWGSNSWWHQCIGGHAYTMPRKHACWWCVVLSCIMGLVHLLFWFFLSWMVNVVFLLCHLILASLDHLSVKFIPQIGAMVARANSFAQPCKVCAANLDKLQNMKIVLARVAGDSRRSHVTPFLATLQGLPVKHCTIYKVATITPTRLFQ